jgi:hypothetical protein
MAFLFDKKYFGEAEDEFEDQVSQEQDRYSQLRDRLLSGQTLGYGELEELYAAAKAKGDAHVVGALKNVVGEQPTDAAGEQPADGDEALYEGMLQNALDALQVEPRENWGIGYRQARALSRDLRSAVSRAKTDREVSELRNMLLSNLMLLVGRDHPMRADLEQIRDKYCGGTVSEAKEQAQDVDEAELSQEEMDDIADMFAGYSGLSNGDDRVERRERQRRMAADFMRRHSDELKKMLDQPSQASGLGDFSHAYDFEANESKLPDDLVNEALETLRRMY